MICLYMDTHVIFYMLWGYLFNVEFLKMSVIERIIHRRLVDDKAEISPLFFHNMAFRF